MTATEKLEIDKSDTIAASRLNRNLLHTMEVMVVNCAPSKARLITVCHHDRKNNRQLLALFTTN